MHEVNPTSLWKKKPVHIACTTISGGLSKTWAALAKKWHNFWTHEANFHNTILIHALTMQKLQLQKKTTKILEVQWSDKRYSYNGKCNMNVIFCNDNLVENLENLEKNLEKENLEKNKCNMKWMQRANNRINKIIKKKFFFLQW